MHKVAFPFAVHSSVISMIVFSFRMDFGVRRQIFHLNISETNRTLQISTGWFRQELKSIECINYQENIRQNKINSSILKSETEAIKFSNIFELAI